MAPGRVLALETLTNTPAVANVIREAKTYMLPGIIQTGKKAGHAADGRLRSWTLYDRDLIRRRGSLRAFRPETDDAAACRNETVTLKMDERFPSYSR